MKIIFVLIKGVSISVHVLTNLVESLSFFFFFFFSKKSLMGIFSFKTSKWFGIDICGSLVEERIGHFRKMNIMIIDNQL